MARKRKKAVRKAPVRDEPAANGAALSSRPVWSGNLRLSLVSCPIAIYGAVSRKRDISFHLINPATNNRIRMVPTDPDTGPVNRSDLVKGYEFEKDRYAIVTAEELDAVRLATTDNLEIEQFVDAGAIDRLYWNEPYYLLPDGEAAVEAYTVIRDALSGTGRIALGRVVMHTRERLMAVEPAGRGLISYTLRMRDEVISPKAAFETVPEVKSDRRMIEIAERIIEQSEGTFDASKFKDRYEQTLRDLVERKQEGKTIEAPKPEKSNVIDLMDALKRSLKNKPAPQSKPAKRPTRARRAR